METEVLENKAERRAFENRALAFWRRKKEGLPKC